MKSKSKIEHGSVHQHLEQTVGRRRPKRSNVAVAPFAVLLGLGAVACGSDMYEMTDSPIGQQDNPASVSNSSREEIVWRKNLSVNIARGRDTEARAEPCVDGNFAQNAIDGNQNTFVWIRREGSGAKYKPFTVRFRGEDQEGRLQPLPAAVWGVRLRFKYWRTDGGSTKPKLTLRGLMRFVSNGRVEETGVLAYQVEGSRNWETKTVEGFGKYLINTDAPDFHYGIIVEQEPNTDLQIASIEVGGKSGEDMCALQVNSNRVWFLGATQGDDWYAASAQASWHSVYFCEARTSPQVCGSLAKRPDTSWFSEDRSSEQGKCRYRLF